nr:helix-turn-helix transcriptional regulator [Phytoactinopolyspora endophytica]
MQLARGEPENAAAALRLALTHRSGGPASRGRLLAAQVEVELRLSHVDAAAASAAELDELGSASRAPYVQAMAAAAEGAVLRARGDVDRAVRVLRDARDLFHELSCPYETAEARVLLGLAARQAGDLNTAHLELASARAAFDRLGAIPGVQRVDEVLGVGLPAPHGLSAREIEVLRLVAAGKANREIGTALFISEHTVARHLSNIYRKIDVASRSAATSFAYEKGLA